MVTLSASGEANVWHLSGGKLRHLESRKKDCTAVAAIRGGRVATGHKDGRVTIWPLDPKLEAVTFTFHSTPVLQVAVNVKAGRVAAIDLSGKLVEWRLSTGEPFSVQELGPRISPPYAMDDEAGFVAGVSGITGISAWDMETSKYILFSRDVASEVLEISAASRGRRIAAGAKKGELVLFSLDTPAESRTMEATGGNWLLSLALDTTGRYVAAGDSSSIHVLDLVDGGVRVINQAHNSSVSALAFHPNALSLVSGGGDGRLRIWDLASGRRSPNRAGHEAPVVTMVEAPAGNTLRTASALDGSLVSWSLATRTLVEETVFPATTCALLLASDGSWIAAGNAQGQVSARTMDGRPAGPILDGGRSPVTALALSPDSLSIVASTLNEGVTGWDWPSGKVKFSAPIESGYARCAAFDSAGRTVAIGLSDGKVRILNASSGAILTETSPTGAPINAVVFSKSGIVCLAADVKGRLVAMNARSGRVVGTFQAHASAAQTVAISSDDSMLASGDESGLVVVWEFASCTEITRAQLGEGGVRSLQFLRRSNQLACGLESGAIEVLGVAPDDLLEERHAVKPLLADDVWTALRSDSARLTLPALAHIARGDHDGLVNLLSSRLRTISPSRSPAECLNALKSDDPEIRSLAVRDLLRSDIEVEPELVRTLETLASPDTRDAVEFVLGRLSFPIMADVESRRIPRAVKALANLGTPEAAAALRDLKSHANSGLVRRIVAGFLK